MFLGRRNQKYENVILSNETIYHLAKFTVSKCLVFFWDSAVLPVIANFRKKTHRSASKFLNMHITIRQQQEVSANFRPISRIFGK